MMKRRHVGTTAMAIGFVLGIAGGVHATDVPMPGKLIAAKETKVLKGIFKPTGTFTIPTAGGSADPTDPTNPVTITVFDESGTGGVFSETLIPGGGFPEGWKGLGNPAGSKGWKYKNKNGGKDPGEPCKVVIVKETVIKFICKTDVNIPAAPFEAEAGVLIDFDSADGGDRYCASFEGTVKKNLLLGNGLHLLKVKDAPAPASCTECGNGRVDPGESCDDGLTEDPDACPGDCVIDSGACQETANASPNQLTVSIDSGGATIGTARVFIDYPEDAVFIPGSADDPSVSAAITGEPGTAACVPNDVDHGLINGCFDVTGFPQGTFFNVDFTDCDPAADPVIGDFSCTLLEATDDLGNDIPGATCSVSF